MSKVIGLVVASAKEVWSLLVDDGLLAIAALVAIGVAYVLSRESVLGPVDAVGWALVGMIAASTVVSVRRAVAARVRSEG